MRNKFLSILGLLLFSSSLGACSNTPQTSTSLEGENPKVSIIEGELLNNNPSTFIKWEGRYGYIPKTKVMMIYHTATGLTVDFYGTELTINFYHGKDLNNKKSDHDIYYDVKVDEETLPNKIDRRIKLPKTETNSNITVVNDLSLGNHSVTILKMNEAKDACTGISKIVTDGYFIKRDLQKDNSKIKILALNASYGSGYGALAYSKKSGTEFKKTTANSSSLHAFQYLTARRLNADIHFVASSGWGIKYPEHKSIPNIIEYTGITPNNTVESSHLTNLWNKELFMPNIISIHLGGNDTDDSKYSKEEYKTGVIEFITNLHNNYPNSKIIWNHTNSEAGKLAISALQEAGIIKQGYLKQCIIPAIGGGDTGSGTYGASNHASLKTQIDASEALTSTLSRWGFEPVREQINFSNFEYLLEK